MNDGLGAVPADNTLAVSKQFVDVFSVEFCFVLFYFVLFTYL